MFSLFLVFFWRFLVIADFFSSAGRCRWIITSLGFWKAHFGHRTGRWFGAFWILMSNDVFFFWFCWIAPRLWLKSEKGPKCPQKRRKDSLGEIQHGSWRKNEKRVAWKAFFLKIFQGRGDAGFRCGFYLGNPGDLRGFSVHLPPSLPRRTRELRWRFKCHNSLHWFITWKSWWSLTRFEIFLGRIGSTTLGEEQVFWD